jgi:hypothetical protein
MVSSFDGITHTALIPAKTLHGGDAYSTENAQGGDAYSYRYSY